MRPLLLTGYDDAMACIGDLTAPLMERYAYRHDLDFHCVREYERSTHPAWQKLELVAAALKWGSPWVLWLDADIVITNPSIYPPRQENNPLTVSMDWGEDATTPGDFSTGAFIADRQALPIFEEARTRIQWQNTPLWDQSALRGVWRDCSWAREKMDVQPRSRFCSVPAAVCSGKVPDPWQPGDWLCHLTMVPFARRVELFYEIAKQAVVAV